MRKIGMVLLVLGALALIYGGIAYNRDRTVMEMGSVSITANEHNEVPVPAIVGGVVLLAGIGLLVAGRRGTVVR